ncbi:hypothetical protein [Pinisolibacter aquiterrae]|uniref:hypothetical protein n=1 Tax=Pinisolibacter aquiterrae TaxID=2815579 RepID=UPI001C3E592E|nr:hypothetical protein [Pinisolibacter aquiterrae]MBV5262484.1 hypothetical protein [Pinisolibacter aquiterrae]MCC8235880.1 hypothetical protein [Pinisolibacter aquiterrae]
MGRTSILATVLMVVSATVAAPAEAWRTHHGPRFGTLVDYPAGVFGVAEPSDGGDGTTWTAPGGTGLRVFGFWNALDQTPAGYETFLREGRPKRHAGVTYRGW